MTTKTAQFTPGPWVAERDTARNAYAWKVTGAKGVVEDIARLALVDSVSQIEANATLIAAAPAMYEALSEALEQLNACRLGYVDTGKVNIVYQAVKKALAQAEGNR